MSNIKKIMSFLLAFLLLAPASAMASGSKSGEKEGIDIKEVIFHHLGDGYGWEVPFSHVYRIPLPVIIRAQDGNWFMFSSAKLTEVVVEKDMTTGKDVKELMPVIHSEERDGKTYRFVIAHVSKHKNKVVEIFPVTPEEQERLVGESAEISVKTGVAPADVVIDGYDNFHGTYYREYKPVDISITKNVLALFITAIIVTCMVMSVVRWYARKGMRAPRKGMGFIEMLIDFVYTDVIKSNLGAVKGRKFAPFLLTCFFFILTMNIVGLVVIFPGGANLTGNIAVTMVLALLTFIVTNVLGTKHYWKEIFWPDVPLMLKFPLPIMQIIEIFGIFTKPAALCIRLFANMMGGHMIVITLISLIFIFAVFGVVASGGSVIVSVIFTIFMLALDVLVSFIQAYVFTLLSTMFITMGQEDGHGHGDSAAHDVPETVEA